MHGQPKKLNCINCRARRLSISTCTEDLAPVLPLNLMPPSANICSIRKPLRRTAMQHIGLGSNVENGPDSSLYIHGGKHTELGCCTLWSVANALLQFVKASSFDFLTHLKIPAECIDQLHLAWCLTISLKNLRRRDQNGQTLRPRNGHVEAVPAVKKFHASWRIRMI